MDSEQDNKEYQQISPQILQELRRMDRREKYLYERDKGRLVRFDETYISDHTAYIENIIAAKNMHIALQRALDELSEVEYKIIQECFFSDEKVIYSKLCKKHNITRQVYIRKLNRILLKLRKLVIYHYDNL